MDTPPPPVAETAPRKRQRIRTLVASVVIALLLLPLILWLLLAAMLTPQNLVDRLEAQIDSRVEIGVVEFSLFRLPCLVEVKDLRLGARDEAANNAEKLASRTPLPRALLSAKSARLEGSPWALLTRKLDIRDFVIDGAQVDLRVRKDGSTNLAKLFKQPAIVAGKRRPKKVFVPLATGGEASGTEPAEEALLSAEDVPYAASIRSLLLTQARIHTILKKDGTVIDVDNLRFELSDLDVDPMDLAAHNTGKLRVSGTITISKPEQQLVYARLQLSGDGVLRPFDPVSGGFNPLLQAKLTLHPPSELTNLPSLAKINTRLAVLKRAGINLGDKLGTTIDFPDQCSIDIEYRDGVMRTLGPLFAKAQKIDVEVEKGGYLHTGTNDHFFRIILTGNQSLSDRMRQQAADKAAILPEGKTRDKFLKELMDSFFRDGRFRPVCVSSGDLSDPDVELENKLPDLNVLLKGVLEDIGINPESQKDLQDAAGKLLEGLLQRQR